MSNELELNAISNELNEAELDSIAGGKHGGYDCDWGYKKEDKHDKKDDYCYPQKGYGKKWDDCDDYGHGGGYKGHDKDWCY